MGKSETGRKGLNLRARGSTGPEKRPSQSEQNSRALSLGLQKKTLRSGPSCETRNRDPGGNCVQGRLRTAVYLTQMCPLPTVDVVAW